VLNSCRRYFFELSGGRVGKGVNKPIDVVEGIGEGMEALVCFSTLVVWMEGLVGIGVLLTGVVFIFVDSGKTPVDWEVTQLATKIKESKIMKPERIIVFLITFPYPIETITFIQMDRGGIPLTQTVYGIHFAMFAAI
jgi:hypothetical protein